MDTSVIGAENNYFRKRAVRIYTLCASAVLAVIASIAFALDFEPQKRLFENGSILGQIAFYSALVLALAALILPFVLIPKEKTEEGVFPDESRYLHYYTLDNSFIKILRLCVFSVIILQGVVRAVAVWLNVEPSNLPKLLTVIMLILPIPLALYFIPEVTEKITAAKGRAHQILGSVGLFWFLFNVLGSYFDKTVSLASEYVTLTQLTCIVMMLALVYEIRYHLDGTKVRARLATSAMASVLGAGLGFGHIVMLVSVGQISFTATSLGVTLLALGIYFGARIFFYEED